MLVCQQMVLGLKAASNEDLAHGDIYPGAAPDGKLSLADCFILQIHILQQSL